MFYYDRIVPDELNGAHLDVLLSLGWYRMNQYMFCTSHIEHDELHHRVHWLRYPVSELTTQSSHKRIRNRNRNFRYSIEDFSSIRLDHTELHQRYRESITFNGALTIQDCLFGDYPIEKNIFNTKCISIFDDQKLVAGGYFDTGDHAVASILHFFDPEYRRYSLGKYLILITIDYLETHGYQYYYPGYVVETLTKMNYKLFLGKEYAEYFDPYSISWKKFNTNILAKEIANDLEDFNRNITVINANALEKPEL